MISLTNISSYAILTTRLPTTKYTKKAIKLVDIVANEDNVTNIAHIKYNIFNTFSIIEYYKIVQFSRNIHDFFKKFS